MRFSLARWIVPLACLALFVPSLVSARVSDATTGLSAAGQAAGLSTACSGSATQCIATMVGRALNIFFGFLGIILLGYVIYGGFVWMTASSSKEVDQAQGIIRNAVIGVVIIACSFAISNFVLDQMAQIAGGVTGSGTTAATDGTNPSYDQIADGGARLCCYSGATPALSCKDDCTRTPAAFGVPTTGDVPTACITACSRRLCPSTGPVAGQTICTPGGTGAPTAPTGPTMPVYDRAAFCRSLDVEAGYLNPTRDACRICANGCLSEICGGALPAGMPGAIPPLNSLSNSEAARTRCEAGPCIVQCRIGY